MNNKSLKAVALLALFTVSLAATAATQFTPEKKETTKELKYEKLIRKDAIKRPSKG